MADTEYSKSPPRRRDFTDIRDIATTRIEQAESFIAHKSPSSFFELLQVSTRQVLQNLHNGNLSY